MSREYPSDVIRARYEARRFLDAEAAFSKRWIADEKTGYPPQTCKERAAMRRASLDLSRALAVIRKSGGAS